MAFSSTSFDPTTQLSMAQARRQVKLFLAMAFIETSYRELRPGWFGFAIILCTPQRETFAAEHYVVCGTRDHNRRKHRSQIALVESMGAAL
jgi:hypothetical protein